MPSICSGVAPRVGAWIETRIIPPVLALALSSHLVWVRGLKLRVHGSHDPQGASHLVWVRGLKHQFIYKLNGWIKVAPRVGAWIETANKLKNGSPIFGSHLVWVRGLKLLVPRMLINISLVAPRVGAWIETPYGHVGTSRRKVAPRVGAWIETILNLTIKTLALSRTSCGCVD